jgi:hypothetical protein
LVASAPCRLDGAGRPAPIKRRVDESGPAFSLRSLEHPDCQYLNHQPVQHRIADFAQRARGHGESISNRLSSKHAKAAIESSEFRVGADSKSEITFPHGQ